MPAPWPASKVELRPIDSLVPYARNARVHSPAQIGQLAASLREWGWTNPVLVDEDGTLIAGHGRVLAAQQLGITEAPTMVASGWSKAQVAAYRIADNRLALSAGWDDDLLKIELGDLAEMDFDLPLIGFDPDELSRLMTAQVGLTDPDEAPEPPAEPVSRLGDVWLMGRHRLCCGDSTTAESVDKALNGVKPHLLATDPPYGVEYEAGWRSGAMPHKNDPNRWKDGAGKPTGRVRNDTRDDWREAWALFPGDVAYVWHAGNRANVVADSLLAVGFEIRAQIIWAKNQSVISRGHYHPQHEPCWYAVRKGSTGHWSGSRQQTTLWQIDKPRKSETGHSTQKPVECMKRPIENNSSWGQAIYDPFLGSGTTLIAAEMTGRCCLAIELDPTYIDVSVLRWQSFTGEVATHEETGRTFAELAADRGVVRPEGPVDAGSGARLEAALDR